MRGDMMCWHLLRETWNTLTRADRCCERKCDKKAQNAKCYAHITDGLSHKQRERLFNFVAFH